MTDSLRTKLKKKTSWENIFTNKTGELSKTNSQQNDNETINILSVVEKFSKYKIDPN